MAFWGDNDAFATGVLSLFLFYSSAFLRCIRGAQTSVRPSSSGVLKSLSNPHSRPQNDTMASASFFLPILLGPWMRLGRFPFSFAGQMGFYWLNKSAISITSGGER